MLHKCVLEWGHKEEHLSLDMESCKVVFMNVSPEFAQALRNEGKTWNNYTWHGNLQIYSNNSRVWEQTDYI